MYLRDHINKLDFIEIIGGELDILTKKRFKEETFKQSPSSKKSRNQASHKIDFGKIVNRAR